MALKENKVKKTPEEAKKARAIRIKANALAMYNAGVATILTSPKAQNDISQVANNKEAKRAAVREILGGFASACITAATDIFDEEWKRRRGEFLHDDA